MVSFNKIQKMIDGTWLVKGICFDGDELPQDLNGEEIACGSEIYEIDTGKTYFYFRYEWRNNGSGGFFHPTWINKDLLDFSGGQYKYIYPTSIEELQQATAGTGNMGVLTGIQYSNELLLNFTPQVVDFNGGVHWDQYPFGNIIICIPDIFDDTIYWTVTYYEYIPDSDGESQYINSETVENGMYPQDVPQGYTWEGTYPGDVQIFSDYDFYGYREEEEEEEIPYRYPISASDYIDYSYNRESSDETTAQNEIFIPGGAQFVSWSLIDEGEETQHYEPIIESDYTYLYYYPTSEDEYERVEGWSGLEYTNSAPADVGIYIPTNIYIPGGYRLSDWNYEEEGNPISHYIPTYEQNDPGNPNPGDPEEPGEPGEDPASITSITIGNETFYNDGEEHTYYMTVGDWEDVAVDYVSGGLQAVFDTSDPTVINLGGEEGTILLMAEGEGDAYLIFGLYSEATDGVEHSMSVYIVVSPGDDPGDDPDSGDEPGDEQQAYTFINNAEDSEQIPNDMSTYQGYEVVLAEEEFDIPVDEYTPSGWHFANWIEYASSCYMARYEIESEYPVYYFINDSEDTTPQVPNENSTYLGYAVGSDGEEISWAGSEASENCPEGWSFTGWYLNGDTGDYYAIYSDGSSDPDDPDDPNPDDPGDEPDEEESDAWNSFIVGSLHEGSNEIILNPGEWLRYSFTTPSDLSALVCYSEFSPRDVKCILFDDQGHVLTAEDDAYNGEEEELISDFYLESDQVEPNSHYYFALYLYTSEEEPDIASGTIYIETPV